MTIYLSFYTIGKLYIKQLDGWVTKPQKLQYSASNMFAYLWEPCCPGETWSCSERGEAAAAGRGQTWPPVARSEQGWPGNRGQRLGWRLLCNHPDRGYLHLYIILSTLDQHGQWRRSAVCLGSCDCKLYAAILGPGAWSEYWVERENNGKKQIVLV